jgi:ABC-2 type transport system ATP-binding protein
VVINRGEIIAEGTPDEVKGRTAGRRIRCITSLPIAKLCEIPGVLEVHSDRDAFVIGTTVAEPVLRELFLRDPQVSGIEVTSAGLEEAFLALTQDSDPRENARPR